MSNKVFEFKEQHPILTKVFLIFFVTFVSIGIPYIINRILFCDIRTHNSTDGEWLSFWGSFLGGIIGGMATLAGVVYTIKKSEKSSLQEKIPELFPMDFIVYILSTNTYDSHIFINNNHENLNKEIKDNIYIKIRNFSKGPAFNCKLNFTTSPFESIEEYLDNNLETPARVMKDDIFNKTYEIGQMSALELNYNEKETMFLLKANFKEYLINIFKSLILNNENKSIPIGKLELTYDDFLISKKNYKKNFDIFLYNNGIQTVQYDLSRELRYTKLHTISLTFKPCDFNLNN